MKLLFTCIFLYNSSVVGQLKDTCKCSYTFTFHYPENALKNKVSGTVVIEMDLNEDGTYSNPVVFKRIGYGCDEEAIKSVKRMINKYNECALRCKQQCPKRKVTQSITFELPEN
jgi:TonB family protein